jgi:hypothetical protein
VGNLAKFKATSFVLAAIVALSACGSSGSAATLSPQQVSPACTASMVAFRTAAVAAGADGLSGSDRNKFVLRTFAACTKPEWLVAVKPYTGPDTNTDIVVTSGGTTAKSELAQLCQGIRGLKACS